jgi:nitrous oxide reductase accessory protein NosL
MPIRVVEGSGAGTDEQALTRATALFEQEHPDFNWEIRPEQSRGRLVLNISDDGRWTRWSMPIAPTLKMEKAIYKALEDYLEATRNVIRRIRE